MKVRPGKVMVGLVGGAVVLFGVGTNVQAGWVLVLSALLLGFAAAGAFLPFAAVRGLEVSRDAPAAARAGEPVPVSLVVRNASRGLRGLVGVRDRFCGDGWAVVGLLRPGEARRFTELRTGTRRGVLTSGTCGLASGAPFGVLVAWRDLEIPTTTVVYPRVFDVRLEEAFGRSVAAVRAPAGETSGVREYRPGDQLRHVHWRSTARRGELVVREFEEQVRGDLVVVADTPRDPDLLDVVASVASSVARAGVGQGREVRLCWSSNGGVRTATTTSHSSVDEWGARLAGGDKPLADVLGHVPAGTVVCVLVAGARARSLVPRLVEMEVSAVVVVDPRSPDRPATEAGAAIAAGLRASGIAARVVPVTEDLGPWLA